MKKLLLLTTLTATNFGCLAMQNAEEALRQENADLKNKLYEALKAKKDLEVIHVQDEVRLSAQNQRLQKLSSSIEQLEKYVSSSNSDQQIQAEWIQHFKTQEESHSAGKKALEEKNAELQQAIKQYEEYSKKWQEDKTRLQSRANSSAGRENLRLHLLHKANNADLNEEYNKLIEKNKKQSLEIRFLKDETENSKKQNNLLFQLYKKWETEAFKLEQERDSLNAQVKTLEVRLAAQSSSSSDSH